MTGPDRDCQRKKLLHRARYRGFKEADLLIGGFAESALPAMTAEELEAFETILNCSDHDLYAWILGHDEPPPSIDRALITKMRAFDASGRKP